MLAVANKRHDIVAVTITDPREVEFSMVGLVKLLASGKKEGSYLDYVGQARCGRNTTTQERAKDKASGTLSSDP